jgi:hypothetical protein
MLKPTFLIAQAHEVCIGRRRTAFPLYLVIAASLGLN